MPVTTVQINASSQDQNILAFGASYPPADTPAYESTSVHILASKVFDTAFNPTPYYGRVSLMRFPLAAVGLPAGSTVNSAIVRARPSIQSNNDSRNFSMDYFTWTGSNAAAEYTMTEGTNANAGVWIFDPIIGTDFDFVLINLSNINVSNDLYLRGHITGTTPTSTNWLGFESYDQSPANAPRLILDWSPPGEALRPTATSLVTNLTPSTDPTAYQTIDDDPDAAGTDFLAGTNPDAQTGLTDGPQYPNARTGATTLTAFAWDSTTNVTDTSDTTLGIEPSASTAKGDYFSFATTAFQNIPTNATITNVKIDTKHRAGTANRVSIFQQLGSANGTLLGSEQQVGGAITIPNTAGGVTHTLNFTTSLPTRAQLVSGTFGVRHRMTRSNTATYELYSIKVTVTYSVPASTTNTEVRAVMGNPVGTLITGTNSGEVRIQVRKLGSGTSPQVRAEVREGGTLRATPIADTTLSDTTADGTVLSGAFNQSGIVDRTNVDVYVVGTGASGGLVEVGAVEWNAQTTAGGTVTLTGLSTEESVGTLTAAPGVVTQALTGLSSEESVGTPTAVPGVVTLTLTGLSSEESVGTLTTSTSIFVSLTGLSSEETVGTLTAAPGVVTFSLTGVVSEESVGTLSTWFILNNSVRFAMEDPDQNPEVGADLQEFELLVRKYGSGDDPQVRLELYEAGGVTPLDTPIPDTSVSSPTGVILSGTWDAGVLANPTGADVEVQVVGTGAPNGAIEVGSLRWLARVAEAAPGTITLTGLSSEETVGTLTAVPGVVTVSLTGLSSEESVGTLTAVPGVATVSLTGLSSEETVGTLTAVPGIAAVSLTGLSSEETVGTLTAVPGVATRALTGLSSEESVGTLSPVAGVATVALTGVTSEESVGTLTASTAGVIGLTGVASEESVGTLTPVAGAVSAALSGLSSEESVGTLTAVPGVRTLSLTGLSTEESVGTLTPIQGAQFINLTGLSSEESVGTLTAVPGIRTLSLVGLSTEESVGALIPIGPPVTVVLTALASEEAVGILTAIFVGEYVGSPTILLSNAPKIRFALTVRQKPQPMVSIKAKPQVDLAVRGKPHPVVAVREKAEFTLSSF